MTHLDSVADSTSSLESSLSAFLPLMLSMSTSELSPGDLEPSPLPPPKEPPGCLGDWEALESSMPSSSASVAREAPAAGG